MSEPEVFYGPTLDLSGWGFDHRFYLTDLPPTALLVLVGFGQHAERALQTKEGYGHATTTGISNLTGLTEATVDRYAKVLVERGLLQSGSGMWRLPEHVLHRLPSTHDTTGEQEHGEH